MNVSKKFIRIFAISIMACSYTCYSEDIASAMGASNNVSKGQISLLLSIFRRSSEEDRGQILRKFRRIINQKGIPSVSVDGAEEVNALGSLLLASRDDYPFQEHVLDMLSDRVGVDIDPYGLAVLADKINQQHNGTQLFGSLLCLDNGAVNTCPFIAEADANPLRDQFGLDMLDRYIRDAQNAVNSGLDLDGFINGHTLAGHTKSVSDPSLAALLKKMFDEDQVARKSGDHALVVDTDSAHLPMLRKILMSHGFPNARQVGRSGVLHFFVLVDHADADPLFQKAALKLAKPLLGAGGLRREDYATLCDRVRVNQGLKQIYGTQVIRVNGHYEVKPVADPGKLDHRRVSMGLLPIKEYLKMIEQSSQNGRSVDADAK